MIRPGFLNYINSMEKDLTAKGILEGEGGGEGDGREGEGGGEEEEEEEEGEKREEDHLEFY